MTSIEWLQDKWGNEKIWTWEKIQEWFEQAKEMHRQEIIRAFREALKSPYHSDHTWTPQGEITTKSEQYYQEAFGSKDINGNEIKFQTLSEKYQEYKDWLNEIPEISDEEIEKAVNEYTEVYQCPSEISMCKHDVISAWNNGIKWYREQLKQKK